MLIPEHVVQNGPWSISKAGVIAKCSQQFAFKYGTLKQAERTVFVESRIGSTVHKALEFALEGMKLKDAFRFAKDQYELTTDEAEKLMSFYGQVESFVARMTAFKARHGVQPRDVFIEHKVGVSHDFKSVPFFERTGLFRGVMDYALRTANNDMVIIDHKSGKQKDLKEYDAQFRAYSILALAMFPDLRGVQTAINFIMTDKLEWNPRVTADTIRNEYYPWLITYLTESCTKLLAPPTPTEGWFCQWCGYKSICPNFAAPQQVNSDPGIQA